jgi:hypothetical protein
MRVDEVIAQKYSRNRPFQRRRKLVFPGMFQSPQSVSCADTLELNDSTIVSDDDRRWLLSYIAMIPDELVIEKIKLAYSTCWTAEDALSEKLLCLIL